MQADSVYLNMISAKACSCASILCQPEYDFSKASSCASLNKSSDKLALVCACCVYLKLSETNLSMCNLAMSA